MTSRQLVELAELFHVEVADDNAFQRRARLLQSIWREQQNYPIGIHKERPLGSRLAMPWAQETLSNYLTDTIRHVVICEVKNKARSGKVISEPRIYDNLLSSQPLCFNLFAELQNDLDLATKVFDRLTASRSARVTGIEFEHSPGRGDRRYLADGSAFDVYVTYRTKSGKNGFVGIEVKYHENLNDNPASHKPRYDEVANSMGCFLTSKRSALMTRPLQQIWRDHLLAGVLRQVDIFDDGFFVFLYPEGNMNCQNAVQSYLNCLTSTDSFAVWTLESVTNAVLQATTAKWVHDFADRYLNFGKIDALL